MVDCNTFKQTKIKGRVKPPFIKTKTNIMDQIKSTPNYSKRTFTLRKYDERGQFISKYRTFSMTLDEFNENECNTSNDWMNYLRTIDNYQVIK